jgi:hypothetical protein
LDEEVDELVEEVVALSEIALSKARYQVWIS